MFSFLYRVCICIPLSTSVLKYNIILVFKQQKSVRISALEVRRSSLRSSSEVKVMGDNTRGQYIAFQRNDELLFLRPNDSE